RAELERDRSGSERGDRVEECVDLRELRCGHVDANTQRGSEPAPLRPLRSRGTDDPHADLLDEFRRERQEVTGLEQPEARVPPAEERFDTAALAAAQVDDRLVPKLELASPQGCEELAISERHLCGLARSSAAFHVRARELLDDGARGRSFHAIAASCDRVTRAVRPSSRRSMNVWTSPASHCVPSPWRSRRSASSSPSPARYGRSLTIASQPSEIAAMRAPSGMSFPTR